MARMAVIREQDLDKGRAAFAQWRDAAESMLDDAVNIRGLKRYAVDHASAPRRVDCAEPTGKRVAVVGAGPSGLTAAFFLARMGHAVTVLEQREKAGGMLRYGIPNYRLPKTILDDESLDDPNCALRIDAIVRVFHDAGLSTDRHWEWE